jgi:hypothetical protein
MKIPHPITKEDPEDRIASLVKTCAEMQREIEALEEERHELLKRLSWTTRQLYSNHKEESDARIAAKLAETKDEAGSRLQ